MIGLLFMSYIPEEDTTLLKKFSILTEQQYFHNHASKLLNVSCPNCHDTECLFLGCVYVGCRSCMQYFDYQNFGIKSRVLEV